MRLAPSIMCTDILELREAVERFGEAGADFLHIDIMDGVFVPNFSLNGDIMRRIAAISRIPMDVHLMIQNPAPYIDYFAGCGADVITVHIETLTSPIRTLRQIRALGKLAGIAVSPATSAAALPYLMDEVDLICVMAVEPGFSGQRMISSTYKKVRTIRRMAERGKRPVSIMVDGNVSEQTAPRLAAAGADILVVGSSVLSGHDVSAYPTALQKLRESIDGG